MFLRNLNLAPKTINRNQEEPDNFEAVDVKKNYEKTQDGKNTDTIISYAIFCSALRGDTISIVIPATCQRHVEILDKRLNSGGSTHVRFEDLHFKAYAFNGKDGKLVAGVNGTAINMAFIDEK